MLSKSDKKESRFIFGLHPNVFFMGLTSFLTDISSEMVFTLVPIYLTNVLGAPMTVVGIVGGISEGADALFRIISGWLSDRFQTRKIPAVIGYALSTISKPFLFFAGSWGAVVGVRAADRLGKGVRTPSRDALIADSVETGERGRAFGIHRAMDTIGALLGLLITVTVVQAVLGADAQRLTRDVFQGLSLGSVAPGVLAVVVLILFVKEKNLAGIGSLTSAIPLTDIRRLFKGKFPVFVAVLAVFSLGSMPHNYFAVLRAQDLGMSLLQVLLMLVFFNAVYAAVAIPAGILSDRIGRRKILAAGWLIYGLDYLVFASADTAWHLWIAFAGLGIYFALVEGVSKAYIADLAPSELRGTAYGLYYSVTGICVLSGGIIGGLVWDQFGPEATFWFGAGTAFLAMLGILTLLKD